jgi:thiamine pyrophosphokinase
MIFVNGDRSDISCAARLIDEQTILIGCDGGTDHILTIGRTPDVVIGDFDSFNNLPPSVKRQLGPTDGTPLIIQGTTYVHYPTDKDFTDTEAAIRYAARAGYYHIILTGTLGSRLDHLLGTVFLLTKAEFADLDLKIIEGSQEMYLVDNQVHIIGQKGDTISFIPISGIGRASSHGLMYELDNYKLSIHGNQGISNQLARKNVDITVIKGPLLVIHGRQ